MGILCCWSYLSCTPGMKNMYSQHMLMLIWNPFQVSNVYGKKIYFDSEFLLCLTPHSNIIFRLCRRGGAVVINIWHLHNKICPVRTRVDSCMWKWALSIMLKHNQESVFPGFWEYVTFGWLMLKMSHVLHLKNLFLWKVGTYIIYLALWVFNCHSFLCEFLLSLPKL